MPVRHNGTPYRGINVLLLWSDAISKGFESAIWMTYKQAAELKGQVKKGEHGSLVVYADRMKRLKPREEGAEVEREIPFLRGYTVFNVEQISCLPDHYYVKRTRKGESLERIETAEQFFASSGATFRHGGNMAYYAPGPDVIQLPPPEAFKDAESYAGTKAHELLHWTKHERRLNREFGRKRFGDTAYAREELVAELGAAFLCATLGITPEPREDHAAYLGHWLKVLGDDKRAIFSAASYAQRAVDFLHRLETERSPANWSMVRYLPS
jgi:antirestriction protein ArdC